MRAPVEQDHIPFNRSKSTGNGSTQFCNRRRSMSGLRAEAGDLDTAVL